MFEEIDKKNQINSAGHGNDQAEDIFSSVDSGALNKPEVFQPKVSSPMMPDTDHHSSGGNRVFLIGTIVLVAAAVFFAGFFGYRFFKSYFSTVGNEKMNNNELIDNTVNDDINNVDGAEAVVDATGDTGSNAEVDLTERPLAGLDSDQDGLTDEEELVLGTDINNIDTDNDGLFDKEEVSVYNTDPNNPDSDGDGYMDGVEVKGGYNPNGPGKLYEIK